MLDGVYIAWRIQFQLIVEPRLAPASFHLQQAQQPHQMLFQGQSCCPDLKSMQSTCSTAMCVTVDWLECALVCDAWSAWGCGHLATNGSAAALQGSHAANGANTPCHFVHMLPCHQAVGRSMPQRSHTLASCISISILPCDWSSST